MASLRSFFENAVPISTERHVRCSVRAPDGYDYARKVNAAPVVLAEFEKVAQECPIVFGQDESHPVPLVLLGLRKDENVFVSASGSWDGSYVPAYIRSYPFWLSEVKGRDDLVACVDEPSLQPEGDEGRRLFDDGGNHTGFLDEAITFLRQFREEYHAASAFGAYLQSEGLLKPTEIKVKLGNGRAIAAQGLRILDRVRFDKVPDATLLQIRSRGWLDPVYRLLHSLDNVQGLAKKVDAAVGGGTPLQ